MEANTFKLETPFTLENGQQLSEINVRYHTAGTLNEAKDNVIWVCHALTANSDVFEWWPGLFGPEDLFNPKEHFIICANILGSCYGSSHALDNNPQTGEPYYHDFPQPSIRDMVQLHDRLRQHLGLTTINLLIGSSLGGQQAMEWAIMRPYVFNQLVLIATNAQHSPWGIAFNESQRMAIQNDATWSERREDAGLGGLATARSIAMLSYRSYATYLETQSEDHREKLNGFKAASYQRYQGQKLQRRFDAFAYWRLSKAMDGHNVARGRGSVAAALGRIQARTLVIGVSSDQLFPTKEQQLLAQGIPQAEYLEIDSIYGHDGFLIETPLLSRILGRFYRLAPDNFSSTFKKTITMNPSQKNYRIGLFGYGCVGQGFYQALQQSSLAAQAEIVKIGVKNPGKERDLPDSQFFYDKNEILEDDSIDLIVEAIDDAEEAFAIVKKALQAGKLVVAASKKMVASYLQELLDLQENYSGRLLYEASVCGSIPVLRTVSDSYGSDSFEELSGIFNGSSNFILSKLDKGGEYDAVLREAQELGFAETDPTLDVQGFDAKYKLCILAAHAFGLVVKPEDIPNLGIQNITAQDVALAKRLGLKIKPLVKALTTSDRGVQLVVLPEFVPATQPLYRVDEEYNGVQLNNHFAGPQLLVGKGAGSFPTGSAVLADVGAVLAGYRYDYSKRSAGYSLEQQGEVTVYIRYKDVADLALLQFSEVLIEDLCEGCKTLIARLDGSDLLRHQAHINDKLFVARVEESSFPIKQLQEEALEAVR